MILSYKQTDEVFTNTLRALDLFNVEHQDEIYKIFSSFTREPLTFTKEKGSLQFKNKNVHFSFIHLPDEKVKNAKVFVEEISNLGYEHRVLGLNISDSTTLFGDKTIKSLLKE